MKTEPIAGKPKLAPNVMFTTVWLFLAALGVGAIWILAGINRAFAGFAVQDESPRPINDFFEALVFAPTRLLSPGNNFLTIASTAIWVFLLCLLASYLYHWIRCRLSCHVSGLTPRNT